MLLDGKVALVTGAGRGLGRGHALALAAAGARVVVNDLGSASSGEGCDPAPAQAVVDEIRAAGGDAVADGHSVANWNDARAIVGLAIEHFGRLDIVVNNAGLGHGSPFGTME
jgi:NAD(P)-dependent dehydrogenase (short-subunit alcohol dehydrogenase family)